MNWQLLVVLCAAGTVWCDEFPNINVDDLDVDKISEIDQEQIQKSAEAGKKAIKEKCFNVTKNDQAFEELEGAREKAMECIVGVVNITSISEEIEEAKKRGAMEEVFGKYCKKKQELLQCVEDVKVPFDKCLLPQERDTVTVLVNLTESLIDFLCYKDGDRIAMFIAEGGFKCIEEKRKEVEECVNSTLQEFIPKNMNNVDIVIDEKKCNKFNEMRQCVTKKLETCENKTPANVMEALFKYIKKSLPCDEVGEQISSDGVPLLDHNRLKRQSEPGFGNNMEKKCQQNSPNQDAFQQLNDTFINLINCARANILMGEPDSCPAIRQNTVLCTEEFLPKLKRCLLPKEYFLADLVKDSVTSILDFTCNDNAKNLREYKNSPGLQCLNNSESKNNVKTCLQRFDRHKTEGGQVVVEKETVCKDINSVRECLIRHVEGTKCNEHAKFVQLVDGFLGAMHAPCSASSIFVNVALIAGVLYLQFRQYWL